VEGTEQPAETTIPTLAEGMPENPNQAESPSADQAITPSHTHATTQNTARKNGKGAAGRATKPSVPKQVAGQKRKADPSLPEGGQRRSARNRGPV
jgi:hypothetical protein